MLLVRKVVRVVVVSPCRVMLTHWFQDKKASNLQTTSGVHHRGRGKKVRISHIFHERIDANLTVASRGIFMEWSRTVPTLSTGGLKVSRFQVYWSAKLPYKSPDVANAQVHGSSNSSQLKYLFDKIRISSSKKKLCQNCQESMQI